MSKKISELMDGLDYTMLKDFEVEDSCPLSQQLIKSRALEGIKVTPLKQTRKSRRKMWLPLVAALTLLTGSVIAVQSSPELRSLLGNAFVLVEKEAQTVQKQVISEGIIFTVEEAVIDDKSGMIVASFAKEDGTTFEENIEAYGLQPKVSGRGGLGWGSESTKTLDGKKIISVLNLSGDRKLHGTDLTLGAKYVGWWKNDQIISDLNLDQLYQAPNNPVVEEGEWSDYQIEEALNISVSEKLEAFKLDGISFEKGKMEIYSHYLDPVGEEFIQALLCLVDKRTGEKIKFTTGSATWDQATKMRKMKDEFEGITAEDLKHYALQVEYDQFIPVAQGPWEITFKLDENQSILRTRPFAKVERGDLKATLTEIEVSALGVKIEGFKNQAFMQDLRGYLLMKDGSRLNLRSYSTSSSLNTFFTMHLQVDLSQESENEQKTEQPRRVEGATQSSGMGESTISISTQPTVLDEDSMPYLIDIQEVKSIGIEGVEIPFQK